MRSNFTQAFQNRWLNAVAILFAALVVAGCTTTEKTKAEKKVQVLENYQAQKYSNIYFGAQPPIEKLDELKAKGFTTVINLRDKTEESYREADEGRAAKVAILDYVNVPISGTDSLDDKDVEKITQAINKNKDGGKVLVHCSTGNRAALYAGAHFYRDHGFDSKDAREIAQELGLTKKEPLELLDEYMRMYPGR